MTMDLIVKSEPTRAKLSKDVLDSHHWLSLVIDIVSFLAFEMFLYILEGVNFVYASLLGFHFV